MKATNRIAALTAAALFGSVGAAYAVPVVSNVTMNQRVNSRIVDIGYTLTGEAAIITMGIETNGVPIPDAAVTWLYKDVCKVVQTGTHAIVWNAGEDWPENLTEMARARVTAWATNAPPQVMVIDLSKGTSATKEDPYPVFYYTSAEAVPRGVTNDLYKTDRIVMQRLSPTDATGFVMGEGGGSKTVYLTQAFYAGVYAVTQQQWVRVMGTDPSQFKNPVGPVERVSYNDIRGTSALGGAGWPATNLVDTGSFIGKMRDKTGISSFDLPTDAQWEYACRAGTTTYYNDGINGSASAQLDALGWWSGNSVGITHTVGQKMPNGWGLYDMHGNVWEWCLDWYQETLLGGTDTKGAVSGSTRMGRGGSWGDPAQNTRSAFRIGYDPSLMGAGLGFRFVRTLP